MAVASVIIRCCIGCSHGSTAHTAASTFVAALKETCIWLLDTAAFACLSAFGSATSRRAWRCRVFTVVINLARLEKVVVLSVGTELGLDGG